MNDHALWSRTGLVINNTYAFELATYASQMTSLKLRVQNTIMMIAEEIVNYNNFKIACKKFVWNYFNEFLRFPILKELKRVKG